MADERKDVLRECPFCGGPVHLEQTIGQPEYLHGERQWWGVVCRNTINLGGSCAVQQRPSASKEAATKRWNRRAAPVQPQESAPSVGLRNAKIISNGDGTFSFSGDEIPAASEIIQPDFDSLARGPSPDPLAAPAASDEGAPELVVDDADIPRLLNALRNQRQLDEDGVEIGVSRQAVDHVIELVSRLRARLAELGRENVELRKPRWTCYRCGESFTDKALAAYHFGPDEEFTEPACVERMNNSDEELRKQLVDQYRELEATRESEYALKERAEAAESALAAIRANVEGAGPQKLWLWKNFVDGKQEYWAFDNEYPCESVGGDPLVLGEPCGYAIFKVSARRDLPKDELERNQLNPLSHEQSK